MSRDGSPEWYSVAVIKKIGEKAIIIVCYIWIFVHFPSEDVYRIYRFYILFTMANSTAQIYCLEETTVETWFINTAWK